MNYFDDIEWVGFNRVSRCRAIVDKVFPDYFVLMYAHSGKFMWQKNKGKAIILEGPVVWWTYPGPYFKFGRYDDSTTWDHRFVSFRGKRVESFIKHGLFDDVTATPFKYISNSLQFCEQMDQLLMQLETPMAGNNSRAVHMLEGILLLLQEESSTVEIVSPAEERVTAVIGRVKQNPIADYDFHQIADELFLSYSHFRRLFKMLSGYAPNQFVLRMRMKAASNLLRNSNLGIKEIAAQVCCEDIYYFSKMFKKIYNIPPGRYRKGSVII